MTSHSNAVLASHSGDPTTQPSSLCLVSDVRAYSTTPRAHTRDLTNEGITGNGIAIYHAIADRQVYDKVTHDQGEYFRSNHSLAEETKLKTSTVRKWIALLKKKGYISIWYVNGGRRMRVCTKVCYPDSTKVLPSEQPSATQIAPYKQNNIKKTTQQLCSFSSKLSEKHRALFGEKNINTLADTYGEQRVMRGLLAFDAEDIDKIRTPIRWLTSAIKDDYEPRKAARVGQTFTENTFEHYRIVKEFKLKSSENVEIVKRLEKEGFEEARIAYRIWEGTIC